MISWSDIGPIGEIIFGTDWIEVILFEHVKIWYFVDFLFQFRVFRRV